MTFETFESYVLHDESDWIPEEDGPLLSSKLKNKQYLKGIKFAKKVECKVSILWNTADKRLLAVNRRMMYRNSAPRKDQGDLDFWAGVRDFCIFIADHATRIDGKRSDLSFLPMQNAIANTASFEKTFNR